MVLDGIGWCWMILNGMGRCWKKTCKRQTMPIFKNQKETMPLTVIYFIYPDLSNYWPISRNIYQRVPVECPSRACVCPCGNKNRIPLSPLILRNKLDVPLHLYYFYNESDLLAEYPSSFRRINLICVYMYIYFFLFY